jgi:hypothetical protein
MPKTTAEIISGKQILFLVKPALVPVFFQLLGQGFTVNVRTGISVKDLVCRQLGINEAYLEERIQTILLNAKAVDDVNSTIVREGSTLALSGAMPGLVGVTLRRGGFYAAMRSQISHDKIEFNAQQGKGRVIIKLFNLVVKELGPDFLQQGVWLRAKQLHDFVVSNLGILEQGCKSAKLDGQDIKVNQILGIDFSDNLVNLKLKTESKS